MIFIYIYFTHTQLMWQFLFKAPLPPFCRIIVFSPSHFSAKNIASSESRKRVINKKVFQRRELFLHTLLEHTNAIHTAAI